VRKWLNPLRGGAGQEKIYWGTVPNIHAEEETPALLSVRKKGYNQLAKLKNGRKNER